MANKSNDDSSLSHTRWNCKYHIVFIPKFRRKAIYEKLRMDIRSILRQLYNYKNVEIIEAHAMKNHIHMILKISPKIVVSSFMGYLKGKSLLMIFERHTNLKYKYGNRNFWSKGYYVSTVGLNTKVVEKYIKESRKGRPDSG
ncbi:putative transposase [Bisgaardia hudsonensis]|uniref:Putative transposase n=1 Tax=Bisgaardia hudsonensis TaxID=109472 RepID=A0A4R2N174_9PAST|nr:putative transposase [Bisgaardia hudsonensis]